MLAVYTTVSSREQARELARALVQQQLAACAQICPIESFYGWRGTLQNEPEFRLLLKTTAARYAALELAIRRLHPYELPAIYALAAVRGFAPYARWVADSCSASPGTPGASARTGRRVAGEPRAAARTAKRHLTDR
jgi:periplasmic divalent cation tolerance protein